MLERWDGPIEASLLFEDEPAVRDVPSARWHPDLDQYVEFLVFFSGGKDSSAAVLHLLDLGVSPDKITIHHHLVDGAEGSRLMDWPVTHSYCEAFAHAFGMRYEVTWREGGFEREMLREDCPTAPVVIPSEDGGPPRLVGGKGPANTRRKFPQTSADMSVRWCSSYLKSDVGRAFLSNTARFQDGAKRLVITGERADESPNRARYAEFGLHPQDARFGRKRRHLDHWRAVHGWKESEVWDIMRRYRVDPHPAYKVGYSRCSCKSCIFIDADSWATLRFIAPQDFQNIANYEAEFGVTIHRSESVGQRADKGLVLPGAREHADAALSSIYTGQIITDQWTLPTGAFRNNGGCF